LKVLIAYTYKQTVIKTYNTLVSVLYGVTKNNNGALLLNKCKTVEHWAQESKKGLINGKIV